MFVRTIKYILDRILPEGIKPVLKKIRKNSWKYYHQKVNSDFPDLQLSKKDLTNCIISYNKYGAYCIPKSTGNDTVGPHIEKGAIYEPLTIEYIIRNCGSGDIIHAGAYFGDFLPAFSTACLPGNKIWAFEPNSESFRCAQMTIKINGIKNVELINAGLGEKEEILKIKTKDIDGQALGGGSQVVKEKEVGEDYEEIQIVTIDDVINTDRDIAIIHLDIEGYEIEALMGAIETIRKHKPILILEKLPNSTLFDSEWFKKNILEFGYKEVKRVHGNIVLKAS